MTNEFEGIETYPPSISLNGLWKSVETNWYDKLQKIRAYCLSNIKKRINYLENVILSESTTFRTCNIDSRSWRRRDGNGFFTREA